MTKTINPRTGSNFDDFLKEEAILISKKGKPTPMEVKAAREAAGLTQAACAEVFGYALRTWQGKEDAGAGNRGLSVGEYAYLILLAGEHPNFILKPKRDTKK